MSRPRELLILRHGRAGEADSDRARPLTAEGLLDVERVGAWIKTRMLDPDATLSSPATRARMTAEATSQSHTLDERIYDASATTLLTVLADALGARVLLVGHNPSLSHLASYLSARSVALSPGSLVRLQMPPDWGALESGCAALLDRIDARDLLQGHH